MTTFYSDADLLPVRTCYLKDSVRHRGRRAIARQAFAHHPQPVPYDPVRKALAVCSAAMAAMASLVGLYLAKSSLGIDLFPGPSPLHPLYVMLMT